MKRFIPAFLRLLVLLVGYWAWPFFGLRALAEALEAGDLTAITALVTAGIRTVKGWARSPPLGIGRGISIGDTLQSLKLAFCGFCGLRGILWRYCDSPLGVEERHWNGILDRNDTLCRSPAMPNGRCRMHGGLSPGAPKGNRNAFKHGRYTAESLARRRELAALLRTMRALAGASAEED